MELVSVPNKYIRLWKFRSGNCPPSGCRPDWSQPTYFQM